MADGRTHRAQAADLGAYDDRVRLPGLINPARYPPPSLQTVPPLALFAGPLRSQLYAKVARQGPDKDGKIDFDRPGRLVGNWFHASLSPETSRRGGREVWEKELAFAYDVRTPTAVRIAIGGTLAPAGTYAVPSAAPDPADVSADSGWVEYELLGPIEDHPGGAPLETAQHAGSVFLRVRVLNDGRLQAQCRRGAQADPSMGAGTATWIYER